MAELISRLSQALADRYLIERELGRGGMGIVVLAHDLKHDRKVAIKVLRPEVTSGVGAERFLREIRIAARLQYSNILPLIDSGEEGDLAYYVMPYMPGESLRERLDRETHLPIDTALEITRDIAGALAFAHEQGIVHRDVKPENILLASGRALLADFGIAQALAAGGDKLTQTGVAIGTPAYMSPEQGSGSANVDHRSDIYSLGCVLYEMLTGNAPFTGSYQVILARKSAEAPPGIRVVRDTVPPAVEQVIMKALARVPADRFETARDFATALSSGASRIPGSWELMRGSRRRWLLAGAAGAVVLIGGTYVLAAGRPFSGSGSLAGARHQQLTSDHGVEWFPSVSPDGKWIVYSGQQTGNRDILLQGIGAENVINLTRDSPADDDQPVFSPDGERIAFRSARQGGGIFVMGRTGEAVRRVADQGFRPTWSPDGMHLAFVTENIDMNPGNSESASDLWIVNAASGERRKLGISDAVLPAWSPNGHRIAYTKRLGRPAQGDIYTIDPAGGEPVPLIEDPARDWSPAWSPDGRYLYFSSNRGGSMNLWRVAVDERSGRTRGAPEPLTTPATFLAHPAVAGDGTRIVYTSAQITINVHRIAFDPVKGAVAGEPIPVTTGSRQFSSPDPSPDGEWVAYYTLNQPEGDLYISRPDGTQRRQLTSDTAVDRLPRWSPDGQWIATFSNRAGPLQLWRVRPDGSGLQRIAKPFAGYIAWSPDSKRIATVTGQQLTDTLALFDAYGSEEQEGEVLPRTGGEQFLVNSWSPDGERLTGQVGAVGAMGRGIGIYTLRTKRYEKLTDFGEWPVWLPDSRRILFVSNGRSFHVLDTRTRAVRTIWTADRDVIGPPRLSGDGQWAYFTRRVTEGDVWLLTLPVPD